MSIRARLILGNIVIVAALFAVLGLLLRFAAVALNMQGAWRALHARAEMARHEPIRRPPDARDRKGPPEMSGPYRPIWYRQDASKLDPDETRTAWDMAAVRRSRERQEIRSEVFSPDHLLILTTLAPPNLGPGGPDFDQEPAVLQVALPLAETDSHQHSLDLALIGLFPVSLLFAGAVAWLLTGRALKPVTEMAITVNQIQGTDTKTRLPDLGSDEFGELSASFNGLLDRVSLSAERREAAIRQLRQFTADASHELKTPLTVIRGTASFGRDHAMPADEAQSAFSSIDKSATYMHKLVQDLLLLAQSDEGKLDSERRKINLAEALAEAADGLEFPLSVDISGDITANREQLVRILRNLMENAIRYATSGTQPSLLVTENSLSISNTCEPMSHAELAKLGTRFYRPDESRARKSGGSGLGLAIAKELAAANGLGLNLDYKEGVFTATLSWN